GGEVAGEGEVVARVAARGVGQIAADGAERLPAGGERDDDRGGDAELVQDREVLLVAGDRLEEVGRDLGQQFRLAGFDHAQRRVRVAAAERERLEATEQRFLLRVDVDDLEAAYDVAVAHVEDAPVGEHRDGQAGDALEGP